MQNVEVRRTNERQPYRFLVTVEEGGTATQHRVTLREADDGWLWGGGSAAPTQPPTLAGICDPRGRGRADPARV